MKRFILLFPLIILTVSLFAFGKTMDASIAPGKNYDKAEFRIWYKGKSNVRGIIVLMPGSNGDGRSMVDDSLWQSIADDNNFALLGCYFTDHPHGDMAIEQYADVKEGSGMALLNSISILSRKTFHKELAHAPLFLWGISAGGEFNYEFVCWKPERVIGFIVNKGGVYYSALAPIKARLVPGLFLTGEKDLESRTSIIKGIFEINRRFGALWSYAEEPGVSHEFVKSKQLAIIFFKSILKLRLPDSSEKAAKIIELKSIPIGTGYLGDSQTKQYFEAANFKTQDQITSWLPDLQFAKAWLLFIQGKL